MYVVKVAGPVACSRLIRGGVALLGLRTVYSILRTLATWVTGNPLFGESIHPRTGTPRAHSGRSTVSVAHDFAHMDAAMARARHIDFLQLGVLHEALIHE